MWGVAEGEVALPLGKRIGVGRDLVMPLDTYRFAGFTGEASRACKQSKSIFTGFTGFTREKSKNTEASFTSKASVAGYA